LVVVWWWGLFWVAFLVWGLWRLQVACQKVQECAGMRKNVQESVEKVQKTMSILVAAETASKVKKR
jgi:hypothetical protein